MAINMSDLLAQMGGNEADEAARRFDAQLSVQKSQVDNQYRIAKLQARTQAEQLAVDKWYREQQVALAQQAFNEGVRQFDKTYGLNEANVTGWFNGQQTLAAQSQAQQFGLQQAALTGTYGGQQTLAGQQQNWSQQFQEQQAAQNLALNQAALTGIYANNPTLAAQAQQFGQGVTQAGLTGMYGGQQTQAAQQQAFNQALAAAGQTGTWNGQQTQSAQQQAFNQAATTAGLTGMLDGRQTLAGQQQAFNQQLARQQFGLNLAQTAAEMRARPDMLFQYRQFQGQLPAFLGGPTATAPTGGPQGQTPEGQLAELGYLSAAMPGAPGAVGQPPAAGGTGAAPAGPAPLSAAEQSRYDQITARRAQLAAAGEGDVSADDLRELQGYLARGAGAQAAAPPPGTPAYGTGGPQADLAAQWAARYGGGAAPVQEQRFGISGGAARGVPEGGGMVYAGGYNPAAGGPNIEGINTQGAAGRLAAMGLSGGAAAGGAVAGERPGGGFNAATDPTLQAMGKLYQRGFASLGAQDLEKLDPNQLGFLKSAGTYQGYDPDQQLRAYQRSRLGQ